MEKIIICFKLVFAWLFSLLTFIWGGFDTIFIVLLCLMAIDYISGVLSAIKTKSLSSRAGFSGLLKKIGILCIVALSHFIAKTIPMPEIRPLVIGFYIANEGISILENAGSIGVPLPEKLISVLQQLNKEQK